MEILMIDKIETIRIRQTMRPYTIFEYTSVLSSFIQGHWRTNLCRLQLNMSDFAITHHPGIFLSLNLLLIYGIKFVTMEFLCIQYLFSTGMFYRWCFGLTTDCSCAWCVVPFINYFPPVCSCFICKPSFIWLLFYKFDIIGNIFVI